MLLYGMQRRDFVTAAAWTAASARRILGANERVVMGLIGCGGRGRYVARMMREVPGVEYAAVCDVYERNAAQTREWAGPSARAFSDFRKLLELKEIDAVHIATPDHWHAIPTVLACQAGKHVFVEKPLAHNVREGRAMVEAARRYKRIVMPGTQHRSAPHLAEAARIVQSGELGRVHYVRVWNYSNMYPNGIGSEPDGPAPEGLDWDFYLGPAPKRPFNRKRFLGSYRWFWDYSGGYITDFGTHRFDTVHQIMGVDLPVTVAAAGRKFAVQDAGEVPDMLQATYEYPNFIMSYEGCNLNAHGVGGRTPGMRYYNARGADDRPNGMAFYGTNGALYADRLGFEVYPDPKGRGSAELRMQRTQLNGAEPTPLHARNFIDTLRNRKKPVADVEDGHRATNIGHLGNIAMKTGRKLRWDAEKEEFIGDPEANRLLARQARKPWDLI